MPIYFDGNKIKEVYKDGTSIKEVYNGSDLVFKKNVGIKCWGFGNCFVLDKYAVGSYWVMNPNAKINRITGVLGTSGSKINVTEGVATMDCDYYGKCEIGGKTFYLYKYYIFGAVFQFVEEGSVAGNYCMYNTISLDGGNSSAKPGPSVVNTITDTTMKSTYYDGYVYTASRNASKDCFWSKELGFFNP